LPALGVDFQIVSGKGPIIHAPIRSAEQIDNIGQLIDVDHQLPFVSPILQVSYLFMSRP
jgi:uroporphyrinogen decarboxylase